MSAIDLNKIPVVGYIAKNWSAIDSSYVEPSLYNFSVQVIDKNNQEQLTLTSEDGMDTKVRSPWVSSLGAGIFWHWIGTNYTFNLMRSEILDGKKKTQFELNVFSQLFNINIQYRNTGGDFSLKKMITPGMGDLLSLDFINEDNEEESFSMRDMNMGDECSIKMYNLDINYIWNHKKFSYPAAQTFSTKQLRSAGSLITGIAYTHYDIENDFCEFQMFSSFIKDFMTRYKNDENIEMYDIINEALRRDDAQQYFGGKLCSSIHFSDVSLNLGYAYNWVSFENFLISSSATISPALKLCKGDNYDSELMNYFGDHVNGAQLMLNNFYGDIPSGGTDIVESLQNYINTGDPYDKIGYSFNKTILDINYSLRLAAIWTNSRWYAGAQFELQHYRYHSGLFTKFDNTFGTLNLTLGLHLGREKEFRKDGKFGGKYRDPKVF